MKASSSYTTHRRVRVSRRLFLEPLEDRRLMDAGLGVAVQNVAAPAISSSFWHNNSLPLDVNHDGKATPVDALVVINRLLNEGSGPVPASDGNPPSFYFDTNGDGKVTPLDALRIINRLISPPTVALDTLMPFSIDVTPRLELTAKSSAALPNGTQIKIDVDFNGNGDFNDPGEMNYDTATLFSGAASLALNPALPPSPPSGPYTINLRARLIDADGVEGVSPVQSLLIDTGMSDALKNYVNTPDPTYQYTLKSTIVGPGGAYKVYMIDMKSQTWRSSAEVNKPVWEHWEEILVPAGPITNSALLLIDGGSNGDFVTPPTTFLDSETGPALAQIAVTLHTVIIDFKGVPSEPLVFTNETISRSEDDIIAYTFDKYMRNYGQPGNETWPLMEPMVKSAVRAMDTVQSFVPTVDANNTPIDHFVVTGFSKRGWTTWLTGAVDDRVTAIIPGVFDILNMNVEIDHHYGVYGFFSLAIQPYTVLDVFGRFKTPEAEQLSKIIDPYRYFGTGHLSMPKLLLNSTGDEFFVSDSAQYYFDDIPGNNNYLRYIPNTSHSLDGRVLASELTFLDAMLNNRTLPKFSWTVEPDGAIRVQTATGTPSQVLLWQATNPTARDFRLVAHPQIVWTSTSVVDEGGGVYTGDPPMPAQGATAYFLELTFPSPFSGIPYVFTTEIRVKSTLPLTPWLQNGNKSGAALPPDANLSEVAFALAMQPVNLSSPDQQTSVAASTSATPSITSPAAAAAVLSEQETTGDDSLFENEPNGPKSDSKAVDAVFGSPLDNLLS